MGRSGGGAYSEFMTTEVHASRRRGRRYSLQIPIRVDGLGDGVTVDLSASGVAFLIEADVDEGTVIHFDLTLHSDENTLHVRCEGKVVRVEERDSATFAAAKFEMLDFDHLPDH